MSEVLIPALLIGGIALLLGAVLAVAAVIFKVDTDEKIPLVEAALPGANCGGCGYAGCSAYADAIVNGGAPIHKCSVGGKKSQDAISEIMGVAPEKFVEKKAFVHCSGNCEASVYKYYYDGIHDCAAAQRVSLGPKECAFGCLGMGTCASVCKFSAIEITDGIAKVNESKCTACGACVSACPRGLIELLPAEKKVTVNCKNTDKGARVRTYCKVGCIACGLCERNCPHGAIAVDGVAKIDYDKCTGCGICAQKCPVKCIEFTGKGE